MALGDVKIYDEAAYGYPGDMEFAVAASATLINAGEPTLKLLGSSGNVVAPLATSEPTSADASHLTGGIASSTSTNTASAAGIVRVTKLDPNLTYLCAPTTAASWDTQAEYDALVGSRVLFGLSAGVYTIGATDNAANGLMVQPLDIKKFPTAVRFSIRPASTYLGWATGIS